MSKPRVLVVDDEPQMVGIVAYAFETQGFEVLTAYDGEQALQTINNEQLDMVLLDVMLPRVDGFEICRIVRQNTTLPVILLTARREDEDVIHGLELGADDYMTKPFNPRELALRAQALLRRSGWGEMRSTVSNGPLKIDFNAHQVLLNGQALHLTHNEFELLSCLMQHTGRVLSWQSLLKTAWGLDVWDGGKEMVKTAIYRLRQKIEDEPDNPSLILTVRGAGYTMPHHESPKV
jgi:DNA-binding response OmpR family regulator